MYTIYQILIQFYLYILDEVLAYEVDQILTIDKDDEEALSEAMATVEGEDYVTLFTCTPYGVNSHRLLVRGHRIDYVEEVTEQTVPEKVVQSVRTYYIFYLLAGLIVTACGVRMLRTQAQPARVMWGPSARPTDTWRMWIWMRRALSALPCMQTMAIS